MTERSGQVTPLNLDLTCLQVNSSLEESLATANQVLLLVQTLEPNIITIQCHVTEDSLDYLLFNKLPSTSYDKKYVRSSGRDKSVVRVTEINPARYQETSQHCGGLEDPGVQRGVRGPRSNGRSVSPD